MGGLMGRASRFGTRGAAAVLALVAALVGALITAPTSGADAVSPVKIDLNPAGWSAPREAVTMDGTTFVVAYRNSSETDLFAITDGAAQRIGADVGLANVFDLVATSSTLYFSARSAADSTIGDWAYENGVLTRLRNDVDNLWQYPTPFKGHLYLGGYYGFHRLDG